MKKIVNWLIHIEETARKFYEDAANRFADDKELSGLLRELSEDEKLHYEAVVSAYELINVEDLPAHIFLDKETMEGLENFALTCRKKLDSGTLSKTELMDAVITLETSEVNGLFLYVINSLKKRPEKFHPAVSNIQEHKDRIRKFVDARSEFKAFRDRVNRLPDGARESLLVVDDEKAVANIFNILLKEQGTVVTASNGREALERLSERDFAAVVSDVDMPVMGGIEFYEEAVRKYPSLKDRFVFLTGRLDGPKYDFLKRNHLKFLEKPASIKDVRRSVAEIIEAHRRH